MCRNDADVQLRCGSSSYELSVDGTYQCHDCIRPGHTDRDGFVCFQLWYKRDVECSIAELFWIEYYPLVDSIQDTGHTGCYIGFCEQCMSGFEHDLFGGCCSGC